MFALGREVSKVFKTSDEKLYFKSHHDLRRAQQLPVLVKKRKSPENNSQNIFHVCITSICRNAIFNLVTWDNLLEWNLSSSDKLDPILFCFTSIKFYCCAPSQHATCIGFAMSYHWNHSEHPK